MMLRRIASKEGGATAPRGQEGRGKGRGDRTSGQTPEVPMPITLQPHPSASARSKYAILLEAALGLVPRLQGSLTRATLIEHLTEEDIQSLEAIIDESRQAIENNDLFVLIESDKRFHEYLVNHSHHSRVKDLWSQIMWQWEVLIFRPLRGAVKCHRFRTEREFFRPVLSFRSIRSTEDRVP